MSEILLFSIIESPGHPDFGALYRRRQILEVRLPSIRKAIRAQTVRARNFEACLPD